MDHSHSSPADHAHPLSGRELAELQNSFAALQQRFVTLMREKADLLDKIQEHEVVILKLSSETETIGMYTLVVTAPFLNENTLFIIDLLLKEAVLLSAVHYCTHFVGNTPASIYK